METLLTKLLLPLVAVLGVSALCIFMLIVDYVRNRGENGARERSAPAPSWARGGSPLDADVPHDTLVIDRKAMRESYADDPMPTRAVELEPPPRRSPEPALRRSPEPPPPPRPSEGLRLADLRRQQEQARLSESPHPGDRPSSREYPGPGQQRPEPTRRSSEFSRSEVQRSPEPPRQERTLPPSRHPMQEPPRYSAVEPPRSALPPRPGVEPRDPRRSGDFPRSSMPGASDSLSGLPRRPAAPSPLQAVGANIILNQPVSQAGYVQLPGRIDIIYGNFSPTDPREIPFLWQANDNTPPRYTFSKSPGEGVSHIQLNHYTITSGTQAELRFLEGRPVLVNLIEPEDMERYQTRVNGIPLGPGESNTLSSGDIISMGIYRLKLSL